MELYIKGELLGTIVKKLFTFSVIFFAILAVSVIILGI